MKTWYFSWDVGTFPAVFVTTKLLLLMRRLGIFQLWLRHSFEFVLTEPSVSSQNTISISVTPWNWKLKCKDSIYWTFEGTLVLTIGQSGIMCVCAAWWGHRHETRPLSGQRWQPKIKPNIFWLDPASQTHIDTHSYIHTYSHTHTHTHRVLPVSCCVVVRC